jgi:hypothetical protein
METLPYNASRSAVDILLQNTRLHTHCHKLIDWIQTELVSEIDAIADNH